MSQERDLQCISAKKWTKYGSRLHNMSLPRPKVSKSYQVHSFYPIRRIRYQKMSQEETKFMQHQTPTFVSLIPMPSSLTSRARGRNLHPPLIPKFRFLGSQLSPSPSLLRHRLRLGCLPSRITTVSEFNLMASDLRGIKAIAESPSLALARKPV